MVPDREQTLREWDFQGGPPRADRWAGEHPTTYAALRGSLLGLLWVPVLWLAVREGAMWFVWLSVALIVLGAGSVFILVRRAARYTADALRMWD